mmetsp:Transcript_103933/g.298676  ORF Transcript_103933/g.298676 Transcript_103933/m.298676 type:complete len:219 (+) Transcript_103933:807-1463(+)
MSSWVNLRLSTGWEVSVRRHERCAPGFCDGSSWLAPRCAAWRMRSCSRTSSRAGWGRCSCSSSSSSSSSSSCSSSFATCLSSSSGPDPSMRGFVVATEAVQKPATWLTAGFGGPLQPGGGPTGRGGGNGESASASDPSRKETSGGPEGRGGGGGGNSASAPDAPCKEPGDGCGDGGGGGTVCISTIRWWCCLRRSCITIKSSSCCFIEAISASRQRHP